MPAQLKLPFIEIFICVGLIFGYTTSGFTQRVLQMEKRGSLKTKKYYIGDDLVYSLRAEPKEFQTATLTEILVDQNLVQLDSRLINVKDIAAIRTYRPERIGKALSKQLYTFAGGWTLFSLGGLFANRDIISTDYYIVGSSLVSGWLIRKLVKKRTYRLDGRKRLRILDLDFTERQF